MSSEADLQEARRLFIQELGVSPATADRLAGHVAALYRQRALGQPRETVLEAATWAAQRLKLLPSSTLVAATRDQVLAQLQTRDCPLCIDEDDGRGNSGAPSVRPVEPVGVPV